MGGTSSRPSPPDDPSKDAEWLSYSLSALSNSSFVAGFSIIRKDPLLPSFLNSHHNNIDNNNITGKFLDLTEADGYSVADDDAQGIAFVCPAHLSSLTFRT